MYLHSIDRFEIVDSYEVKSAIYDVIATLEDYLEGYVGDDVLPILKKITSVDASTTNEALDILSGHVHISMLKRAYIELVNSIKKGHKDRYSETEMAYS